MAKIKSIQHPTRGWSFFDDHPVLGCTRDFLTSRFDLSLMFLEVSIKRDVFVVSASIPPAGVPKEVIANNFIPAWEKEFTALLRSSPFRGQFSDVSCEVAMDLTISFDNLLEPPKSDEDEIEYNFDVEENESSVETEEIYDDPSYFKIIFKIMMK